MTFFITTANQLRPALLTSAVLAALIGSTTMARATEEAEFDASFLQLGKGSAIDLTRFSEGASASPGVYRTRIYVNDHLIAHQNVTFREMENKSVRACVPVSVLKKIPFNRAGLPASAVDLLTAEHACSEIGHALPEASVTYDSNTLRLDISIPQIYLISEPRDYVDPSLWDAGIPALLLGYSANAYSSRAGSMNYQSLFGGVNAGVNIGSWYLRHNGNYDWQQHGDSRYQTLNTFLQHDIVPLRGHVLIGESNTSGILFDTLSFRGVQLSSDDRMLPESQRGYAPEIRGVARTNARVTVSQQSQVIYETTVPPGAFLINDLYPSGYGGDLEVAVNEADGSKSTFRVPYASVAQLLRPGAVRYDFTVGQLRTDYLRDEPAFYQGTWQQGLTNAITGYGGLQVSQNYYAMLGGAALGTRLGALAADITQARTHLHQPAGKQQTTLSGQSYRISYSKTVPATGSDISIAAYRFSTSGFMGFATAMQSRDALQRGLSLNEVGRAKNRLSVTAGQSLPDAWGSLYLSGSVQDYWNRNGSEKQFQFGYNNRTGSVSWSVSVNRSYSSYGGSQNNYLLSMSLPLGSNQLRNAPLLRTELSHDSEGRWGQLASLAGTAGNDHQFSYGAAIRQASAGEGSSAALNGAFRGTATNLSGSVSAGKGYQSASLGLSGAMVVHRDGMTLSPYTGDTYALVEAKGAQGARVSAYPGITVDSHGYALVPYLNPYQMNEITLDPKGTSGGVELSDTTQRVAPLSGAVVKVAYRARRGLPLLIAGHWHQQPLPFGAEVVDNRGIVVGSVGQAGEAYALVEAEKGELTVRLSANKSCTLHYARMPESAKQPPQLQHFTTACND